MKSLTSVGLALPLLIALSGCPSTTTTNTQATVNNAVCSGTSGNLAVHPSPCQIKHNRGATAVSVNKYVWWLDDKAHQLKCSTPEQPLDLCADRFRFCYMSNQDNFISGYIKGSTGLKWDCAGPTGTNGTCYMAQSHYSLDSQMLNVPFSTLPPVQGGDFRFRASGASDAGTCDPNAPDAPNLGCATRLKCSPYFTKAQLGDTFQIWVSSNEQKEAFDYGSYTVNFSDVAGKVVVYFFTN